MCFPVTICGGTSVEKTDPYIFDLDESDEGVVRNTWLTIQNKFDNRSEDIPGTIMAMDKTQVEITTSYRVSVGFNKRDLTSVEDHDIYQFDLEPGTDFPNDGTDDIVIYVYVNGEDEPVLTRTIEWDSTAYEEVLTYEDVIPSNILNLLLFLMLIIISAIVQKTLAAYNWGVETFFIGSIFLNFISAAFIWLGVIALIRYVFMGLHKVISE